MSSISTLFISLTQLSGSCWNINLQGFLRQPSSSFVGASELYRWGPLLPANTYPQALLPAILTLGKVHPLHVHAILSCTPKPITLTFVKINYKMETGLENYLNTQNHLNHISKTKSSLFHEHKRN